MHTPRAFLQENLTTYIHKQQGREPVGVSGLHMCDEVGSVEGARISHDSLKTYSQINIWSPPLLFWLGSGGHLPQVLDTRLFLPTLPRSQASS